MIEASGCVAPIPLPPGTGFLFAAAILPVVASIDIVVLLIRHSIAEILRSVKKSGAYSPTVYLPKNL